MNMDSFLSVNAESIRTLKTKKTLSNDKFSLPMETMTEKTPVEYTPETAKEICKMLEAGLTLTQICQIPEMPHISTVYDWQDAFPGFAENYARARARQADTLANRVLDEAMNSHDAPIGRLRMDALKWYASKLAPKKYGDKVEIEQTGQQNFKISFSVPDRDTKDSLKELAAPVARIVDAEPIEAEIVESE